MSEEFFTWQKALNYCETLSYAEYTDWRMPNINELASLVNYAKKEPASNFPDIPTDLKFISSTTDTSSVSTTYHYLYGVKFDTGDIVKAKKSGGLPTDERPNYYIPCVR